jgi:hypothetical protein
MKKTYIEPKNTVVALNVRDNVLATSNLGVGDPLESASGAEGREVIQLDIKSQDAWEEW